MHLGASTESVAKSLQEYEAAWKTFVVVSHLEQLNALVTPTTLSWKVRDKAELFRTLEDNAVHIEQVHIGTVNDRYIASAVLKEPLNGLSILKILERRLNSHDPLGLDSLDYLVKDTKAVYQLLKTVGAAVEEQHNDVHDWLSLRLGSEQQFEAKFTDHIVLEVAIKELMLSIASLNLTV